MVSQSLAIVQYVDSATRCVQTDAVWLASNLDKIVAVVLEYVIKQLNPATEQVLASVLSLTDQYYVSKGFPLSFQQRDTVPVILNSLRDVLNGEYYFTQPPSYTDSPINASRKSSVT